MRDERRKTKRCFRRFQVSGCVLVLQVAVLHAVQYSLVRCSQVEVVLCKVIKALWVLEQIQRNSPTAVYS